MATYQNVDGTPPTGAGYEPGDILESPPGYPVASWKYVGDDKWVPGDTVTATKTLTRGIEISAGGTVIGLQKLDIINQDNPAVKIYRGGARESWVAGITTGTTGVIAIELAGLYGLASMVGRMRISLSRYTEADLTLDISGHWKDSTHEWDEYSATSSGGEINVRFAKDSANQKCYILLGETTTVWPVTRVAIDDVLTNYSSALELGFAISTLSSLSGLTVDALVAAEVVVTAVTNPLTRRIEVSAGSAKGAITRDDGIASPAGNATAAVGSAGALTGAYYYTSIFVTADGLKSAPWPGTATVVNPSAKQVNLTAIPVSSDERVVARWIYRTPATPVDPKDYRFVAVIADNTTTTYTDNLVDGSLGEPIDWQGSASGVLHTSAGKVIGGLGIGAQAFSIGVEAGSGYSCTSVGYQALKSITSGRRNSALGVYTLTSLTTGYECAGFGTHAGQNVTTAKQGTFVGAYSGFNLATNNGATFVGYSAGANAGLGAATPDYVVGVGHSACKGAAASGVGAYSVGVGYLALGEMAGVGSCIGIGPWAGYYANNNRQVFIDTNLRANIGECQNNGLIYGKGESTPQTQVIHLNAGTRLGWGSATVAQLPAAAAGFKGYRAYVTDASVAYASANVGSTVAGGGANCVPVFCTGTAWVIG